MMKPTILMILVLFSGVAAADDIYLTLGGWSAHSHSSYQKCKGDRGLSGYSIKDNCESIEYNNKHNSMIIDYKGFTLGTYKNSYFKRTNLIGYTYRIKGVSLVAAYGTGYNVKDVKDTCPINIGKECLLFSVGYTYKHAKISYIGGAISLAFEINI